MEELHSLKPHRPVSASQRRLVPWVLPQLRVVIVNGCCAKGEAVARLFVEADARITMIDPRSGAGKQLASRLGIRYAEADTSLSDSLRTALDSTLKAWRDIDVVICIDMQKWLLSDVADALAEHRRTYPRVSSYEPRIILVNADAADRGSEDTAFGGTETEGNKVQEIVTGDDTAPDITARLCLFLALPANSVLSRITV